MPLNTTTPEFKLQPAAVDWGTQKTQATVTLPVALVAVLAAAHFHVSPGAGVVFILNGVLVGLITAEVTGRFGNRLGAAPSVWAALIYAVLTAAAQTPWSITRSASTALFLFSIFCYLRYRSTREQAVLQGGLGAAGLALLTSVVSTTIPLVVLAAELLLPYAPKATLAADNRLRGWMAVMLYFVVLCFVGSVGMLAPHSVPMIDQHQAIVFDPGNIMVLLKPASLPLLAIYAATGVCALAFGSISLFAFCAIWFVADYADASLLAAPLSIALAALALPVTRALPKRTATIAMYVGMILLTAFIIVHVL